MRHRGPEPPFEPRRKLRTREHVIADLSYNFLERKVLLRGHWLDAPRNDYGIDAVMFHHNERGEAESGEVRFQLKATSKLTTSRDGKWIPLAVDMRDLPFWYFDLYPVVIVMYDAEKNRGYWLHVQDYVDRNPSLIDSAAVRVTVRIPTRNALNLRAIDHFRRLSLEVLAQSRSHHRGR